MQKAIKQKNNLLIFFILNIIIDTYSNLYRASLREEIPLQTPEPESPVTGIRQVLPPKGDAPSPMAQGHARGRKGIEGLAEGVVFVPPDPSHTTDAQGEIHSIHR